MMAPDYDEGYIDPFTDNEVPEPVCDLANPETCEACD